MDLLSQYFSLRNEVACQQILLSSLTLFSLILKRFPWGSFPSNSLGSLKSLVMVGCSNILELIDSISVINECEIVLHSRVRRNRSYEDRFYHFDLPKLSKFTTKINTIHIIGKRRLLSSL